MSPDGESVVTGAGDETLRFWHVFCKAHSSKVHSIDTFLSYCTACVFVGVHCVLMFSGISKWARLWWS